MNVARQVGIGAGLALSTPAFTVNMMCALGQKRYAAAHAAGHFRGELVPVDKLEQDEHPRPETTADTQATLPPAFNLQGTVTAGNSSGLNDGALLVHLAHRRPPRGLATLCVVGGMGCAVVVARP